MLTRLQRLFNAQTLALLLCINPLCTSTLQAQESPPISVGELSNGMKVLVMEDKRAPVAVLQVWYRIGTSYEHEGITGLSHALEHMMFKGTKSRPSGEFETLLNKLGAENNAFTSQDYTAYYEVFASKHLDQMVAIEADRMVNLVLDEEEFKKEIKVVMEERRMRTDDNPNSLLREQFKAVAFLNSPYRAPVIGWMVDLENMNLNDLKKWYKQWYAPNNATLVVVGDVSFDEVMSSAKKHFAPLKASKLPEVKLRTEVKQQGVRRIQMHAKAKVPRLMMGFKTPGLKSAKQKNKEVWEPYALEVLASILDGGDSARLNTSIVRKQQLAAGAYAAYYGYGRLDNLFVISATPAKDVSLGDLEKAIIKEVEQLKQELVDYTELKRVKTQVIANEIYERDSIQHMATLLGSLESTGIGHELMSEYVEQIRKVTPEMIQMVARKYLVENSMTVAELLLQKEEKDEQKASSGGGYSLSDKAQALTASPSGYSASSNNEKLSNEHTDIMTGGQHAH